MPATNVAQTNFSNGEVSPRMYGRSDLAKYASSVKTMQNMHVVLQGGARRWDGTRFAQSTKNPGSVSSLIPFVVDRATTYMLEFGNLYVRIFTPGGVYTGIELVTPYTAAQTQLIDYTSAADTMFLFHPDVTVQRIRRFSATNWDCSAVPFSVPPFDEQGHPQAVALGLSATSGAGITATATANAFLPSDVGRDIVSNQGIGTITGYTSATVVTITTVVAFTAISIAAGAWYLDFSPFGFIKPSNNTPAGSTITLTGATSRAADVTLSAKTGGISITASAAVFTSADGGKSFYADSGVVLTLTFVNSTTLNGTTTSDFLQTKYPQGAWGITDSVWRTTDDLGKYVRINAGIVQITSIASATVATARIITALSSTIVASPQAWSLEAPVWSAANGYPRTGSIHEQRLWAAGSARYPQTFWGSRTGLYLDFTKGPLDTDSVSFTIASDQRNPILYLTAQRVLFINTLGGEFSAQGAPGKAITPTSIQVRPESAYGSADVHPLLIGKDIVYVQKAGRKLRALAYDFTQDGYVSADLTLWAEHITKTGITSFAYAAEPYQMMLFTLADGSLISCTFDRQQQVTGFGRKQTDGFYEWVQTMPNAGADEIWVIVRRTVNGSTVRYVEWFDPNFQPILSGNSMVYGTTMDAALVFDSVAGQSVFTGLGHLEAKTVDVVADGSVMAQAIVSGGQITIPRTSNRTMIGLHFDSYVTLLTPQLETPVGNAAAHQMKTGSVTVRVVDSLAMRFESNNGGGEELPTNAFGVATLDQVNALFTGLTPRVTMSGFAFGSAEVTIKQTKPLPQHIIGVYREFTVNP